MTDPDETANLVAEITEGFREHAAEMTRVPGQVRGQDVEDQADAMAAAMASPGWPSCWPPLLGNPGVP